MDVALGFDVSTSVIGWALMGLEQTSGEPIEMGHIDLRRVKGFWNKVDEAGLQSFELIDVIGKKHIIKRVFVEDLLKKFRRGASSANTIILLARFNAVVSHILRQKTGLEPAYLDATWARKQIGMKLVSPKKDPKGRSQKQQVFDQLCETTFKDHEWPKKKSGEIQDFCGDEVDAYVISLAGVLTKDQALEEEDEA